MRNVRPKSPGCVSPVRISPIALQRTLNSAYTSPAPASSVISGTLIVLRRREQRGETSSISSFGNMLRILIRTLGVYGTTSLFSPNLIAFYRSLCIVLAGDF